MKSHLFGAAALVALSCTACTSSKQEAVAEAPAQRPVIYQMMVRIFGNDNTTNVINGTREQNGCGRMSDITPEALLSIKRLGANYVWYTGIIQQATKTDWTADGLPRQTADVVKGNAGSPYAIADYYAVSADIADNVATRMEEFDALVDRTHKAGLKVVLDFIPNHVAREYQSVIKPEISLGVNDKTDVAFDNQNNFYYFPGQTLNWGNYTESPAKVSGNDVFASVKPSEYDWYETIKLNYGVEYKADGERVKHFDPIPSTWDKMTDILLYWAGKGVDAFRCDMSEMVPSEFWHYGIDKVKEQYPDILFIAEIYNPKVYEEYICQGGFDYLYDKVELYDSIRSVVENRRPIEAIEKCLTLPTYTNEKVAGHMLNFLENHDEQRIASDFFGKNPQAGIPALYVSALINGNPYMQYFAQELGEPSMDEEGYQGADGRTTIFDYWGLERMKTWKKVNWDENQLPAEYKKIRARYEEVLKLAQLPVTIEGQTVNITTDEMRAAKVFAFERILGNTKLTVTCNFGDNEYNGIAAHDAKATLNN
ncbi:MAG: alpha-amylase family glycosyl hydrolase [Bacteroidales bacterium]|nr:alpha-amylase family glycosyl hydrolase [Bacteroidales bacterium]